MIILYIYTNENKKMMMMMMMMLMLVLMLVVVGDGDGGGFGKNLLFPELFQQDASTITLYCTWLSYHHDIPTLLLLQRAKEKVPHLIVDNIANVGPQGDVLPGCG